MVELIITLLALAIMFVPTIIAFNRSLKYRWLCLILNILLGWLVIPWFVLWLWSMLYEKTLF